MLVGLDVSEDVLEVEELAPSVSDGVGLEDGEADRVDDEVVLGDSPTEIEGVGVCVGLPERVLVEVDEELAPVVRLEVGVWDKDAVRVDVLLVEAVGGEGLLVKKCVVGVLPRLAPFEAVTELVPVEQGEELLSREGVGLAVPEGVLELVPDREPVLEALRVPEALGVTEGEAPLGESEGVGDTDTVPLAVPLPLEVGVRVPEPVPVLEGVCEGDTLGLRVELCVFEGEAPLVSEAVGEADTVVVALIVEEGVPLPLPLPLGVGVGVGTMALGVSDAVAEGV